VNSIADTSDFVCCHVMKNMAALLQQLATDVAKVSAGVSELGESSPDSISNEAIENLQKLDSLHQSLVDLACLAKAFGADDQLRDRLISDLRLSEIKNLVFDSASLDNDDPGTVDFF